LLEIVANIASKATDTIVLLYFAFSETVFPGQKGNIILVFSLIKVISILSITFILSNVKAFPSYLAILVASIESSLYIKKINILEFFFDFLLKCFTNNFPINKLIIFLTSILLNITILINNKILF